MKSLLILILLLPSACASAHVTRSIATPRRSPVSPTVERIVHVIRQLNPQAEQRGWNWRKEYPKYYRVEQLRQYAQWIIESSRKYKQDVWYVVAIIQEQSRFHHDAVSKTQDFGLCQIHCGRRSPWCHFPPKPREKKVLFDPRWSIDRLGQWLVRKQSYCRSLRRGSRMFGRCRKNKTMTGVLGTLGHPNKTRFLLLRIKRILRVFDRPSS